MISEAEAALYDRQIRLWGLDAQTRMREGCVLVIGRLDGVVCEVLKNIVLAGVGRIVIAEDEASAQTEPEMSTWFLIDRHARNKAESCKEHLEILNPLVGIELDSGDYAKLITKHKASVVIASDLTYQQLLDLNSITRQEKCRFYAMGSRGSSGWFFSDQMEHRYVVQRTNHTGTTVKSVKRRNFVPLKRALEMDWRGGDVKSREHRRLINEGQFAFLDVWLGWRFEEVHKRRPEPSDIEEMMRLAVIFQHDKCESSLFTQDHVQKSLQHDSPDNTLAAILGGVLGQDVLNVIGGKEEPICNWFSLDTSLETPGGIWPLCTEPAEEIVE